MGDNDNILYGPKLTFDYSLEYNSYGKCILDHLKQHNEEKSLIDGFTEEHITCSEMLRKSIQLAESLKSIGIHANDVIAVISENHINYFIPIIATIFIRATSTVINNNYTIEELLHCVNISKPKLIFCSNSSSEKALQIQKRYRFIKKVISLDCNANNVESIDDFINSCGKMQNWNNYELEDFNSKEHIAFILYSSGTTGLPKGVLISENNLLLGMSAMFDKSIYFEEKIILGSLPFFHIFGMMSAFITVIRGGSVVVMKRFDLELFLSLIQKYRIISLKVVPPLMVLLAKHPLVDKYDLSSVKNITCGAAPLSKDLEEAVKKRLNLNKIDQGYGLTEIASYVLKTPIDSTKTGSVGTMVPCINYKVVDLKTGKHLGPNQQGELCYKSPMIMKGYTGHNNATAQIIDKDGWFHSGDVGYYDEDKYFYIVDRIKELIKYKGYQIAPAELESILLKHPHIKDAGVVGKVDDRFGELPTAFVVKETGSNLSEAEVQTFVAKKLAPYKRLHGGVKFVAEIPKNPSGKLLRKELRKMLNEKSKL